MFTKIDLHEVTRRRLVAVVVIDDPARAVDLAGTLVEAGLDVLEVAMRTPAAAKAIQTIAKTYPDILLGAGTLLTEDLVMLAADSGAKYGLAPGLNPRVIAAADSVNMAFMPGVMTPTEVETAMKLGCRVLKFFPAEQAGGVAMLKALEAAYLHTGIQFVPTGGINASNMVGYLALKSVPAVAGSWFVARNLTADANWKTIEKLTREALAISGAS